MAFARYICLVFFVVVNIHEGYAQYSEAVLLGDVKVLTLHKGEYTTSRRSSPIPQLQCVGGSAGCKFNPDVVQCTNMGSDGTDYQWECKTDLDSKYRFGKITVSCEGYNHPNDPYVLRGSCGLEYNLELSASDHKSYPQGSYNTYKNYKSDEGNGSSVIIVILIVCIAAGIYWFATKQSASPSGGFTDRSQPPPSGGFTDRSQPPPYGFNNQTPFNNNPPPYGFKQEHSSQQNNQGGFGGFWTGAGLGGLAGYMFGSRNNNPCGSSYSGYSSPLGSSQRGSSFFGSSSTNRPFASPVAPSSSKTASGFGGTKRR